MNNVHNQISRESSLPRLRRILKLRSKGATWQAIGDLLGVSRQRAFYLGQKAILIMRKK